MLHDVPHEDVQARIPQGDPFSQIMYAMGEIVGTQKMMMKEFTDISGSFTKMENKMQTLLEEQGGLRERVTKLEGDVAPMVSESNFKRRLQLVSHMLSAVIGGAAATLINIWRHKP